MQIVPERCAGLDVHKSVYVCAIWPKRERRQEAGGLQFWNLHGRSPEADGLAAATRCNPRGDGSDGGVRGPVWAVLEGQFELLLVNPQHIKAVPGRKTDAMDCEWIADLLQHGLLRGSFVPPRDIQDLRDLTGYRAELTQARNKVDNRIQKLLEQCNIKLSSVASDTLGLSGQLMLEALIRGEDDPVQLAELAQRKLRGKIPQLRLALAGKIRDHDRFLLKEYLEEWKTLGERIKRVEQEIEAAYPLLSRPSRCGRACPA